MAGVLISPGFDLQARRRCESYKRRNGSPNFKDILRERCRARIKAKRGALFDKMRNSNRQELHNALSGMLQEEVKELTCPLKPMEDMDVERPTFGCWEIEDVTYDEEKWLLDEYEKVLAEEETIFGPEWEEQVICPLCELAVLLKNRDGLVTCTNCNSLFPTVHCLKSLQVNLNDGVQSHFQNCAVSPEFVIITESLFLMCEHCACMLQIA